MSWNLFDALGHSDTPEEKRWRTLTDTSTWERHVVPLRDQIKHDISANCSCKPTQDSRDELRYIHNAVDGRKGRPDDY